LLQLVPGVQSIAGLDLDRGRTVGQQPFEPRPGLRDKVIEAGGPGVAHSAHDPSAGRHDLQVAGPGDAHFELVRSGASPYQVGVGINKTGHDHPSAGIQLAL
jgi:hypothetical protein